MALFSRPRLASDSRDNLGPSTRWQSRQSSANVITNTRALSKGLFQITPQLWFTLGLTVQKELSKSVAICVA